MLNLNNIQELLNMFLGEEKAIYRKALRFIKPELYKEVLELKVGEVLSAQTINDLVLFILQDLTKPHLTRTHLGEDIYFFWGRPHIINNFEKYIPSGYKIGLDPEKDSFYFQKIKSPINKKHYFSMIFDEEKEEYFAIINDKKQPLNKMKV